MKRNIIKCSSQTAALFCLIEKTEKGVSVLSKERLTKRIDLGNGKYSVDFANDIMGEFLNDHKKGVKALFHKIAEYEDLEEQGLLLRLPCKVGDIVWAIATDRHTKEKLVEETTIRKILVDAEGILLSCDINPFSRNIFGETIFSTLSEAERKLKELVDLKDDRFINIR